MPILLILEIVISQPCAVVDDFTDDARAYFNNTLRPEVPPSTF